MNSLIYSLYTILLLFTIRYGVRALSSEANEEIEGHRERMMADWYNETRYPRVECSRKEQQFFKSCHNYKPSKEEEIDDRNGLHGQAGAPLGLKARRPDGGCERIDFRTATPDEWRRYRMALNGTYNTLVSNRSEYQVFASYHRYSAAKGAHYGPAFLSWHREYLKRFEAALQMQDPSVCLMFSDWTLDHPLSNPCDSVMFSEDFFGTSNGSLTGFWSHWRGYAEGCEGPVWRECVPGEAGRNLLFNDSNIEDVLQRYGGYEDWCAPQNPEFETDHAGPHIFIGGTMAELSCAVNDVLFWSHHSTIDSYWQKARNSENNQNNNYPTWSNISEYHIADAPMRPFHDAGLVNRDGLRLEYDDTISYRPARIPCSVDCHCNPPGSVEALWCFEGMCTSKIRVGGQCDSKPDNACYKERRCVYDPQCVLGVCTCK